VEELAEFVVDARWDDISDAARDALKQRVLDALGCAIGGLDGVPVRIIRDQVEEFGGKPLCTLIGGGRTGPDRAALYNGTAVRYLDFNDSYLAKGETCHPSDNLAPVLAASEYVHGHGRDVLTALAVAYQVQCRLSDVAPVRAKGFDHTVQGAYSVAAGVARALRLDATRTANAVAIAGTAFNALRVTRTGALSNWKGLAFPNLGFAATQVTFLAMRGITGPLEVFEGNKGLMDAITGPFEIEWRREDLERVRMTILKKYNAEIHSQSTLEAVLELRAEHDLVAEDIARVDVEVFEVAYHIIGGGEEGGKQLVATKEQADHSLPYLVAVALLDGQVTPAQYAAERIRRQDVQDLLRRVIVRPDPELSARFPERHACRVHIHLRDGRVLSRAKEDYEGFHTRPASWQMLVDKFMSLSRPVAGDSLSGEIADMVMRLDQVSIESLMSRLARVPHPLAAGDTGRM
jgi:2-methylcitrate dehydratase